MSRNTIIALIPHAGPMCLLEDIVAWDNDRVHCTTGSHRNRPHPLGRSGRLGAAAGIEYAAQAAAVHGGLLARARGDRAPRSVAPARLAALKDCVWTGWEIAAAAGEDVLDIYAKRCLAGPAGSIYDFSIVAGGRDLITGRLTVKTSADAFSRC